MISEPRWYGQCTQGILMYILSKISQHCRVFTARSRQCSWEQWQHSLLAWCSEQPLPTCHPFWRPNDTEVQSFLHWSTRQEDRAFPSLDPKVMDLSLIRYQKDRVRDMPTLKILLQFEFLLGIYCVCAYAKDLVSSLRDFSVIIAIAACLTCAARSTCSRIRKQYDAILFGFFEERYGNWFVILKRKTRQNIPNSQFLGTRGSEGLVYFPIGCDALSACGRWFASLICLLLLLRRWTCSFLNCLSRVWLRIYCSGRAPRAYRFRLINWLSLWRHHATDDDMIGFILQEYL